MARDPLKKATIMLDMLENAARAATPGHWRRNHGVITSKVPGEHDPNKWEGYVVALAAENDTKRIGLMGHSPDVKRANANFRYIEAASPNNMLALIEAVRAALDLPKEPDHG